MNNVSTFNVLYYIILYYITQLVFFILDYILAVCEVNGMILLVAI